MKRAGISHLVLIMKYKGEEGFICYESGGMWCNDRERTQNKPTPCRFIITPVLTSLPSVSKTSKSRVMRYCVGATSCHMQFLFGGYSLGQPGLVIDPFSLVMKPPQAAVQKSQHRKRYSVILCHTFYVPVGLFMWVDVPLNLLRLHCIQPV